MKYTYDEVYKIFEEHGYELISKEYANNKGMLQYKCKKHYDKGIQHTSLGTLLQSQSCIYCLIEEGIPTGRQWPEDVTREMVEELGCEYVGRYKKNNNTRIQFICNKHRDYGIQEVSWTSVKKKMKICSICNGNKRDTKELQRLVDEINPNITVVGKYKNARTKIKCKCKIDGNEWEVKPYNLLSGYGCPVCARARTVEGRTVPKDEKMRRLKQRHPDIIFLNTPKLNVDKVECECRKCGCRWSAMYANLVKEDATNCPQCAMSSGERKVKEFLDKYKVKYEFQKEFDDLKHKRNLRFDFYLPDYNMAIEYDGEFHYKPYCSSTQIDIQGLKDTQMRDKLKNEYCKQNGIHLIRIPYTEFDNLEQYLSDKVRKCLRK